MKTPENELWTEVFKLWPAAMDYEYLPVTAFEAQNN